MIYIRFKKIDYKGYFTLEADRYLENRTPENVFEGIKNLAIADGKLVEMFMKA